MTKSKRNYKKKIVRKYVEFYPNDKYLLDIVDKMKRNNISFNHFVKRAIEYGTKSIIDILGDQYNDYRNL